jgi:hypothetical protein
MIFWIALPLPTAPPTHSVFFPYLAAQLENWLGVNLIDDPSANYFRDLLRRVYHQRVARKTSEPRNDDIFQLFIDLTEVVDCSCAVATGARCPGHQPWAGSGAKDDEQPHATTPRRQKCTEIELIALAFNLLLSG